MIPGPGIHFAKAPIQIYFQTIYLWAKLNTEMLLPQHIRYIDRTIQTSLTACSNANQINKTFCF
jgi:hypothetical protein